MSGMRELSQHPDAVKSRRHRSTVAGKAAAAIRSKKWRLSHLDEIRAKNVARWAANPVSRPDMRENQLRLHYGLSLKDFNALLEKQGGVCAICKNPPRNTGKWNRNLSVDHDHVTGSVRGLLCEHCNRAIGLLGDNALTIHAAAAYVFQAACRPADQRTSNIDTTPAAGIAAMA